MSSDSPAVCGAPLPSPPPAVTRLPVGRDDVVIEQGYCLDPSSAPLRIQVLSFRGLAFRAGW